MRTNKKPLLRQFLVTGTLVFVLLTQVFQPANVLAATNWYVAPTGDDSSDCRSAGTPCRTISAAIAKSAAGDSIVVAPGTYAERLIVQTALSIIGTEAATTIIKPSGGPALTIYGRGTVTGLTLADSHAVGAGGGVTNYGTLVVSKSIIRDNITTPGEGYQGLGGGVYNSGTLELHDSTISGNTARETLDSYPGSGQGGGIYNAGVLTITGSTVSGNNAQIGGAIYNSGNLTVTSSTISGNEARADGGGLANVGAGIAHLTFSTVTANIADSNADGFGKGGGIAVAGRETYLTGTLLAANQAPAGQDSDCAGAPTSYGFNLIQDITSCALDGDTKTDVIGRPANLVSLADNGGPTATYALAAGSPAIDAGGDTCPTTDQRGTVRPAGKACDIGAYEYAMSPLPTCPCSLWDDAARPATLTDPESRPVELGVKFRSEHDGYITSLRFYKGPENTGTHTGTLWSPEGKPLATATFVTETAEGWQEVQFDAPIPIRAGATYVASYHTEVGLYSVDESYFLGDGLRSGPLWAMPDGLESGNGVYQYGPSAFPTETYRASNYWVDVVFTETLTWQAHDLGTLGGDLSIANDINNRGEIVGASTIAPDHLLQGIGMHAFVWRSGQMLDLGTLPGGTLSQALAINSQGVIVGDSNSESSERHAVIWQLDGSIVDLGTLGGSSSSAADVNTHGQVVGNSSIADGPRHAFLWQDGVMTDLGTLGGAASAATGISDCGEIVGYSQNAQGEMHAVLWRDGVIIDLGGLPGGTPSLGTGLLSQGTAINNWGEIVGFGRTSTGSSGFLWRHDTFTILGTLPGGGASRAEAINKRGQIVGGTSTETGEYHPFLWSAGTMIDLGTLTGRSYSYAIALNERDQIVGASGVAPGASRAVIWQYR